MTAKKNAKQKQSLKAIRLGKASELTKRMSTGDQKDGSNMAHNNKYDSHPDSQ